MRSRVLSFAALFAIVVTVVSPAARASCSGAPVMPPLSFAAPSIVDPGRAGGEPSVLGLSDGTLLYASHAGTTHLYKPNVGDPEFITPYNNSVYMWRSTDDGGTWRYVGLEGTQYGPNALTGYSDPTLAEDSAGNAYVAGIDLANVYVAKSGDRGSTWLGQPGAAFGTDREWLAADQPNVVYMNGNAEAGGRTLWKSKDGGLTWNWTSGYHIDGGGPPSPIAVDPTDGRLYFPAESVVEVFPDARAGDYSTKFESYVFGGLDRAHGFFNSIAIDGAGNVYVAWNDEHSVGVVYSTDRGSTWSRTTVATSPNRILWPWVSARGDGHVGLSWLQADAGVTDYYVWGAESITAHGWADTCATSHAPIWQSALATPSPIHHGTICEQGTTCNLSVTADRRLGDYHTNSITKDGKLVISLPDRAMPRGSLWRAVCS
ncbi:MAG: hypothetical protein LC663_04620 [Actinobacteria bacterium]|nr:hypothetical protein [Actinomycetota bacterium]